jgi:hypothetical protein
MTPNLRRGSRLWWGTVFFLSTWLLGAVGTLGTNQNDPTKQRFHSWNLRFVNPFGR